MEPARWVPFTTVFNFRDLGGYATSDGRKVRTGRLYRSDGLYRLAADELERFGALGVRTVVDLRRPDELTATGRVAARAGLAYHHVSLQTNPWTSASVEAGSMARYLADRYAEIAEEGVGRGTPVGTVLRLIADAGTAPLVFHCAAGKDRTGVVVSFALHVAGVPREEIVADYAATGERLEAILARLRSSPVYAQDLDSRPADTHMPHPHTMEKFLAIVDERFGGPLDWLERHGWTDEDTATLRSALRDGNR
jgi:protein-tyrosine phosphatase